MVPRDYNRITLVKYPRKHRKRKIQAGSIADMVHHAETQGVSYGKYVAEIERYEYSPVLGKSTPDFGRPSSWTHPNRTLLEGLNQELRNPETRAAYLNDNEAKAECLMREANRREAERKEGVNNDQD